MSTTSSSPISADVTKLDTTDISVSSDVTKLDTADISVVVVYFLLIIAVGLYVSSKSPNLTCTKIVTFHTTHGSLRSRFYLMQFHSNGFLISQFQSNPEN